MGVARHIRPALFAVAATLSFFAQVEARTSPTLALSSCVTSCIKTEGCETSDAKCVCQGAKSSYMLDHVAVCMYYNCPDQIRTFDASFITPLVSVCNAIGKAVPQSMIDEADQTAQTFADKLPPLSTSKTLTPSTTSAKATPKTTATTSPSTQSTSSATSQAQPTETDTSATASTDDETTTAASSTTTDSAPTTTTLAIATSSPTRAATQSSTSTHGASRSDPTDSSPFATYPNAAGRSATSWVLASLPLALAVMMR